MRVTGGLTAAGAAQAAPTVVTFFGLPTVLASWAAMPAGETEFAGGVTTRQRVNLAGKSSFRIQVGVGTGGFAGSKLRVKYSLDSGATWTTIESAAGTTGDVAVSSAGLNVGASATLATAAAVSSVWLAVFGVAGNAVVSPTFANVIVTFA